MNNNTLQILSNDGSQPIDLELSQIMRAENGKNNDEQVIEIRRLDDGSYRLLYWPSLIPDISEFAGIRMVHKDDLMFHSAEARDGGLDMKVSGQAAMTFMNMLIGMFEQNGGKNFLTLTVERDPQTRYSVEIRNLNGEFSAAEKLKRLEEENDRLKAQLAVLTND